MGVEQDGLGGLEVFGVFYEIEDSATICRVFIKRDARGTHEGPPRCQAGFGRFITMKLQQGRG